MPPWLYCCTGCTQNHHRLRHRLPACRPSAHGTSQRAQPGMPAAFQWPSSSRAQQRQAVARRHQRQGWQRQRPHQRQRQQQRSLAVRRPRPRRRPQALCCRSASRWGQQAQQAQLAAAMPWQPCLRISTRALRSPRGYARSQVRSCKVRGCCLQAQRCVFTRGEWIGC